MGSVGLYGLVWQAVVSAAVAAFGVFAFKMYKMRIIFYRLKKQGLVCSSIITLSSLVC